MTKINSLLPPNSAGIRRAAGIGALTLLLSGCVGTTTAPWGFDLGDFQAPPSEVIGVAGFAATHTVRFRGGGIGAQDRQHLGAFIGNVARNRPDSLRLVVYGRPTPSQAGALSTLLTAEGVPPGHVAWASHGPTRPARGSVAVAVERAIAIAPNCPGWMGHPTAPEDVLPEPNFGCANTYNLAAMLADPHHLRQGASSIYYLGERGASDVAAYRTDKVKPLPKEGGFGPGSAGGGGGGGGGGGK